MLFVSASSYSSFGRIMKVKFKQVHIDALAFLYIKKYVCYN